MIFIFAGCTADNAGSKDAGGAADNAQNQQNGDGPEEETEIYYIPDLPDADYGGYEFKVYQRGPEASEWSEVCIYAEEETGEPINDAVYKRNRYVEGKYNINIVPVNASGQIYDGPIKREFEKSVLAGERAFDMAMSGVYDSSLLARQGYLVDLYSVPHIALDKPWWDIPVNDTLKIRHKLYFGISCMGINDKDDSFCVLFNKKVAQDLGTED